MTGASIERRAVWVPNRRGERMCTVVCQPHDPPPRPRVVVFCQAGLQNKSGVGDYFRWLGDRLAEAGNCVVRFDQTGTGDSEGLIEEEVPLNHYFRAVQAGVSADDTVDLLRWIDQTLTPGEIVLFGQCGGCISALLACAARPDKISGLILLALPVLLSPLEQTIREYDAKSAWKGYLDKLLQPRSYLRLLRGQSDWRLLRAALLSSPRALVSRFDRRLTRLLGRARPDHELFNPRFWESFQAVMRLKLRVLFLMAELDNETPDFDNEFRYKILQQRPEWTALCKTTYLPNADHSLMFDQGRQASREAIVDWFGPPPPGATA